MKSEAKLNADDVNFVEATIDNEKRSARIERLSRSRLILYRVIWIQVALIAFLSAISFAQKVILRTPNTDSSSTAVIWSLFLMLFALWLYTDLQIKFLKADEARFSIGSGYQSGTTAAS